MFIALIYGCVSFCEILIDAYLLTSANKMGSIRVVFRTRYPDLWPLRRCALHRVTSMNSS